MLDGIREIKKGKSQFIPLFALSFLWVLIFVGLSVSLMAVEKIFQENYESLNGHDLQITSEQALTSGDVDVLGMEFGRENVLGNYSIDLELPLLTGIYYTRAVSFASDDPMNQIHLIEGRLPTEAAECLVSPTFLEETALQIGDTILFSSKDTCLNLDDAIIVGVGHSSEFLSNHSFTSKLGNGTISSQVYMEKSHFEGDYSVISLVSQENVTEKLHRISQAQWDENSPKTLALAQNNVDIAKKNYEEVENIVLGQLQNLESEIKALESTISQAWALWDGESQEDLHKIRGIEAEYNDKLFEIQHIQEKSEEDVVEFRKAYEQALRDYKVAEESRWEIRDKTANLAYRNFFQDLDSWTNFAYTVPAVFFWIYLVISLFIMSRTISEQRSLIGGLLAIGYKKREILYKYLFLSTTASVSSAVLANLLAMTVVSFFIHEHWAQTYFLGEFQWNFYPLVLGVSLVLSLVLPIFTTIFTFYVQMKDEPASLMRPVAPPPGRHILLEKNYILWNDMKFNQKIAVRTLFRYKTRLVTSVLAVAVTTALIITALGVQGTYPKGANSQFEQIYRYNVEITARNQVVDLEFKEILAVLSQYSLNDQYSVTMSHDFHFALEEDTVYGVFYIFETTESGEKVLDFRLGQFRSYYMPQTGVVLPIKLANLLDVELGDGISFGGDLTESYMMVTALMEQYHQHEIYMTADYYQWLTGKDMVANKILLELPQEILDSPQMKAEFEESILSLEGTKSLIYMEALSDSYTTSNNLLKNAMLAFFLASCLLAYLVLNQLNYNSLIYRRRELASLKVLGLYDNELSAYIYRENIIYTFLGVVLGVVMGQSIYLWFVKSLETVNIMLYRSISLHDYLRGAGMTVVFALVVNIRSHFKIKKMSMVEDLKQTE